MIQVASYCRVSTDQEDQQNSFASQQRYFEEYIRQHPDWELYAVYADEGITGTSTKKRIQFNRMIQDAYAGKFQLILTKEVSRFSRNILDTIAYTRELKAIGVGVQFMLDGIHTMAPDAELYLSIMASLAQEESRKTSSRVQWGQTRQMERGVVFGRSMLGYDVHKGALIVEPQGAEIVKRIFEQYALEQLSTSEIARRLTKEGYRTHSGGSHWSAGTVVRILRNEKYVGDLVQRKTYTPDYLTHEKRSNHGEVPMIRLENHHEAIINRELWDLTQARLAKNHKHAEKDDGHSNCYIFSGKIRCGECGSPYVGRFRYGKNGTRTRRWMCGTALRDGAAACSVGKLVRDDDAMQMLRTALLHLSMDKNAVAAHVTELAMEAIQPLDREAEQAQLQVQIDSVRKKKERAMDACFSGDLTKEEWRAINRRYDQQLQTLRGKLRQVEETAEQQTPQLREEFFSQVLEVLTMEIESEVFCKSVLKQLNVYQDRHMELRLEHLPQVFRFQG